MTHLKQVFFFILLFTFSLTKAQESTPYFEKMESWIIIDAQQVELNSTWLELALSYPRTGIILNLKIDNSGKGLVYVSESGKTESFKELCLQLIKDCKTTQAKHTLIIDVSEEEIPALNAEITWIEKQIPINSERDQTFNLESIFNSDDFIIFSRRNNTQQSQHIHFFDTYFTEYSLERQTSCPGKNTTPQAAMLHGLTNTEDNTTLTLEADDISNSYFDFWDTQGIQPVFLVADNNLDHFETLRIVAESPNYLSVITGEVNCDNALLDDIYWENRTFSSSRFCLPYSVGKEITPYKAGYNFTPQSITLEENHCNSKILFTAEHKEITDQLEFQLNINETNLKNSIQNKRIASTNGLISKNTTRGKVLNLNPGTSLPIGKSKDFNLIKNSFTIAVWHYNTAAESNCIILGTNTRQFHQGLNIQLKNGKPHFGFFKDDLISETSLAPNQWNHLVYSFDNVSHEKQIFVNGELVSKQQESHAFSGADTLYIGKALNTTSEHNQYMDDLLIWSRALAKEEVKQLYNNKSKSLKAAKNPNRRIIIVVGVQLYIAILLMLIFRKDKTKKKKHNPKQKTKVGILDQTYTHPHK